MRKQREILGTADPYNCCILGSKSFLLWHQDDLRTLWCYGAPGAGKSVAAASVYAELSRQHRAENIAITVAFCSFDEEESQSPRNVIASFLKQILQSSGSAKVSPQLKEHYSRAATSNDSQPMNLGALSEILRDELKSYDGVYVILDGLDEASDPTERAAMVKAVHDIGASVKVIITSRHSEDIIEAVQATQTCNNCNETNAEIYWRSLNCPVYVVCDTCHAAPVAQGERKHQTKRELTWRGMWYQPGESDMCDYVTRRMESDRNLSRLLGPASGQEALRESVVNTVTEKSEKM